MRGAQGSSLRDLNPPRLDGAGSLNAAQRESPRSRYGTDVHGCGGGDSVQRLRRGCANGAKLVVAVLAGAETFRAHLNVRLLADAPHFYRLRHRHRTHRHR